MTVTLTPRFGWTSRADGDLAGDLSAARPGWTWLHQVHGAEVVTVTQPGEHAGVDADAAVTAVPGCVLAVRTADCAPLVLLGQRSVGVVHAGWRGLVAGVVERATSAMVDLGDAPVAAHLGPCIRVGCYEFDGPELDDVVATVRVWRARHHDVGDAGHGPGRGRPRRLGGGRSGRGARHLGVHRL